MNGLDAWLHTSCHGRGPCSHVLTPNLTGTSDSGCTFQPVNLDSVDFLLEQSYGLLGITTDQCSDVINHSDEDVRCACKVEHRNLHNFRPPSAPSIPSRPDIPYDLTIFGRKIDLRGSKTGPCAVCGSGRADDDDVLFKPCRRQSACNPAAANVDGRRLSTAGDFHERCLRLTGTNSSDFTERLLSSNITSLNIGLNTCAMCRCCHDCNVRNPAAENDFYNTSIECGTAAEICDVSKPGIRSTSLRVDPSAASVGNTSLLLTLRKFDEIRRESQAAKERIYGQFESRARQRVDGLLKSFLVPSRSENEDTITRGNNNDSSATLTATNSQSGSSKTASLSAPSSKPIVADRDCERQNPHALTLKVRPASARPLCRNRRISIDNKRRTLKTRHVFDLCDAPPDEIVSGVNVKTTTHRFSAVGDVDNGAETMCEKVPFGSGFTSQFSKGCVANRNSSLLNYGGSPSTLRGLAITELLANFDHIRLAGLKARQQNCYDYQQRRRRRVAATTQPPIG